MTEILRIYDPPECDADGWPLDWERCRTCTGRCTRDTDGDGNCGGRCAYCQRGGCRTCGGHGSLRAAALAYLTTTCGAREKGVGAVCNRPPHEDRWHAEVRDGETLAGWGGGKPNPQRHEPRCEGCGHPMSDGTWEGETPTNPALAARVAAEYLRRGAQPPPIMATHWSSCDEGCRHAGKGHRIRSPHRDRPDHEWLERAMNPEPLAVGGVVHGIRSGYEVEASWRSVDVRTLGWAHDLRPERLALLCLGCFVERSA